MENEAVEMGLLRPFEEYIRAKERKRCAKIVRLYQPWDTAPKGSKEINKRAELIAHCMSIAALIEGAPDGAEFGRAVYPIIAAGNALLTPKKPA